jgi:outer membrane biosynthesis protein TonB
MSTGLAEFGDRDRTGERAFFRAVAISLGVHLVLGLIAIAVSYFPGKNNNEFNHNILNVGIYSAPPKGKTLKVKTIKKSEPKKTKKTTKKATPVKKKEPEKKVLPKETKKPEKKKDVKVAKADIKKEEPKPKKEIKKPEPVVKKEPDPPPETYEPDDRASMMDMADELFGRDDPAEKPGVPEGTGDEYWDGMMDGIKTDPRLLRYLNEVSVVLEERLRIPLSVPNNQGLHYDVIIKVDEFGKVLEKEVYQESGNIDLDRAFERMLSDLEYLPKPGYKPENGILKLPLSFSQSN